MDEKNKDYLMSVFNELKEELNKFSETEKRELSWYWQSSFTNVIERKTKSMHIRFLKIQIIFSIIEFNKIIDFVLII